MESARPAETDDRAACIELLSTALDGIRAARGGATLVRNATPEGVLARWMDAGAEATVQVGVFHHVVVGLAAATASVRSGTSELSGRIECCYVEEEARGVGVGSALMQSVLAWCTQMRCADVDALALPGDRLTKQRLEAAGFTARLLVLNRRLN